MANLKVRAVEGRMCPHEFSLNFVGWRACAEGEEPDHVIPKFGVDNRGGPVNVSERFKRSTDAVEVPNNVYYRAAIRVGDLEQVDESPARNALTSAPKKGN